MFDFFDTDESRRNFQRRLSALSLNGDFQEILIVVRRYSNFINELLRCVEDDKKLRQLQGIAQFLHGFLELVESSSTRKL